MGQAKSSWDELTPEQKAILIKRYSKTNDQEIEEAAKAQGPYPVESLWGEGNFRDTGRKANLGESIDSLVGAPARAGLDELVDPSEQPQDMFDYGPQAMAILKRMGRAIGADPKQQPTGFDVASKVTDNPYAGTALATAVDVGAQLPVPMGAGLVGKVDDIAPEAKAILAKIKTPEQAVALKGAEREQYLKALDSVYGDKKQRMNEMDYGRERWYHGSPNDPERLVSGKSLGEKSGNAQSPQIFLTNKKDTAKMYGKPLEIHTNREVPKVDQPAYGEDVSEAYRDYDGDKEGINLRLSGHDGEMSNERWLMLPDGKGLRRSDAAFDPRFKDSDLLLAGKSSVPIGYKEAAIAKAIEERKKRGQDRK